MNERFFDLKKEKQDRMLNAALKSFAQNGYRRASTDEMVKEAGISKGLLFHYFTNKPGLYEFVYDYSVKYMVMELTGAVSISEKNFFEIRRQVEKAKYPVLKNFPYMQQFLNSTKMERFPEALEILQDKRPVYEEAYETIYRRADFSKITRITPERLRRVVDFTMDGLLAEYLGRVDFSPEDLYKECVSCLDELENCFCMETSEKF